MRTLRPALALGLFALLAGLAPAQTSADKPLPLLRGVLLDGSGTLFCLADLTGAASWVKLGQVHEGWKLESFDAERQVLVVSRDGTRRELALESSQIKADAARATLADANELLDKMQFEEMLTKSMEVPQKAMAQSMGQMLGKNASAADRAKMIEVQAKAMKIMMDELDLPGMKQDMAKAMSEIYTSEEIRAQTAFYSTPAGRATIEKQPALQARITELMMPRMMKAMPKIQAMAMEAAKSAPAPAAP